MTTSKAKLAGLALIAVLCAGFILVLTACTDERARTGAEFNAGVTAYEQGDYATALREWRPLAEQGNANAQFMLGLMYYKGGGVPQDHARAVKWYRKAAAQGVAEAQFNLGLIYAHGRGVPQDYAEAAKWYRKAAEQGIAKAQNNLGVRYAKGRGVPQDYAEAVKWYRKAAAQGYATAQYNLGWKYFQGLGVPKDFVRAFAWYDVAASRLPPGKQRDRTVKIRDLVGTIMTPAQISEAQQLAREWRPKK